MGVEAVTYVSDSTPPQALTPGDFARQILAALDASEGRRRKRKRNTTADSIGMSIKQDLLRRTAEADPPSEQYEEWLFQQWLAAGPGSGAIRAMALEVLEEWRLASYSPEFTEWLNEGAPSDDAKPGDDRDSRSCDTAVGPGMIPNPADL